VWTRLGQGNRAALLLWAGSSAQESTTLRQTSRAVAVAMAAAIGNLHDTHTTAQAAAAAAWEASAVVAARQPLHTRAPLSSTRKRPGVDSATSNSRSLLQGR